tara:strand:- start:3 stop:209 length:207 start_codon:yes stop_codon:yes gene_type:complete
MKRGKEYIFQKDVLVLKPTLGWRENKKGGAESCASFTTIIIAKQFIPLATKNHVRKPQIEQYYIYIYV